MLTEYYAYVPPKTKHYRSGVESSTERAVIQRAVSYTTIFKEAQLFSWRGRYQSNFIFRFFSWYHLSAWHVKIRFYWHLSTTPSREHYTRMLLVQAETRLLSDGSLPATSGISQWEIVNGVLSLIHRCQCFFGKRRIKFAYWKEVKVKKKRSDAAVKLRRINVVQQGLCSFLAMV